MRQLGGEGVGRSVGWRGVQRCGAAEGAGYALLVFVFIAALLMSPDGVLGAIWSLLLCLYCTGKFGVALLELALVIACAVPLWSDGWRASPLMLGCALAEQTSCCGWCVA